MSHADRPPNARSTCSVLIVGIDEWGTAVTGAIGLILLFGAAIVRFVWRKARIALYLFIAGYIVFLPIRLWFFQFELRIRGSSISLAYIVEVVIIQIILFGILPLFVSCFFRFRPLLTGILLAYVLSLLLQFFSYAYWTYGTKQNFNVSLSHLDSFYFALGTLTTAGTGSISATSETARGYQALQMGLDIVLVGFVVVVILARYTTLLSKSTQPGVASETPTSLTPPKEANTNKIVTPPPEKAEPAHPALPGMSEDDSGPDQIVTPPPEEAEPAHPALPGMSEDDSGPDQSAV
jgi:hypothetical protein